MKTRLITSLAIALMLVATLALPVVAEDVGEHTESATVTVTEYKSVTVTDNGADGLSFGSLIPGSGKQAEADSPSMNIAAAAENNSDVAVSIKGTDFNGVTYTMTVNNAFWHTADDAGSATAMGTDYASVDTLAAGTSVDIYHWLSVPNEQEPDTYTSTFTYKTE